EAARLRRHAFARDALAPARGGRKKPALAGPIRFLRRWRSGEPRVLPQPEGAGGDDLIGDVSSEGAKGDSPGREPWVHAASIQPPSRGGTPGGRAPSGRAF